MNSKTNLNDGVKYDDHNDRYTKQKRSPEKRELEAFDSHCRRRQRIEKSAEKQISPTYRFYVQFVHQGDNQSSKAHKLPLRIDPTGKLTKLRN